MNSGQTERELTRDAGPDPKEAALAETRCLNPHPGQVRDPAFLSSDFFDARDLVQVKYEMVRRVKAGGAAVTEAAAAFGYSRPSYYQPRRVMNSGSAGSPPRSASQARRTVTVAGVRGVMRCLRPLPRQLTWAPAPRWASPIVRLLISVARISVSQ